MRLRADAGEEPSTSKRDRNPVPDQTRIVRGEVIKAGTKRGQEDREEEYCVPWPRGAKRAIPCAPAQPNETEDSDQRKTAVRQYVGGARDAGKRARIGEVVVLRPLWNRTIQQQRQRKQQRQDGGQ